MNRPDSAVRPGFPASPPVRERGSEPIPGYRLLEPLGSGGFGEVWKCEAPGGLLKAIKFVRGSEPLLGAQDSPAEQELDALHRIKAIRHPFIVSIERVESAGNELLIVMELADRSLQDVLAECRRLGRAGIPRDDLLAYLSEAAEALDVMNFQHGLQHLDIKPANLFLVGGHVKVADFGLVNSPDEFLAGTSSRHQGITPLYAAPEVLQGSMSRHSDQYSLALVYHELLTGTLPFRAPNARQLMMERLTTPPDLAALPPPDQPVLARALAIDPQQRFASCLDFVEALPVLADEATPVGAGGPVEAPETRRHVSRARTRAVPVMGLSDTQRQPTPPPSGPHAALASPSPETAPLTELTAGPGSVPPPVAAPPREPARVSAGGGGGTAIPGYALLECLSQGPLGEVWKARGPDGQLRLAQLLPAPAGGGAAAEGRLLATLGALRHPGLAPAEVLRTPSGRVAVIIPSGGQSIRDRFQECLEEGLPGIPRTELLGYVGAVAETLDDLARQHGLPHLGLCPRSLLVEAGQASLTDFGLLALGWLPTGAPAGPLNARYAAPELTRPGGTPPCDQYSLALIYAEALTGIHPRGKQTGSRAAPARRPERLDLDLLPAPDREVIARALHSDPRQRFASCTAMVEALEAAGAVREEAADSLPPVAPCAWLQGEPVPPDLAVPSAEQLLRDAIQAAEGPLQVCRFGAGHYVLRPGPVLEHRCPIRFFPGALRLKMSGFRQQWGAEVVSRDQNSYVCRVLSTRSFWQRCVGGQAGMEVQVLVPPAGASDGQLSEATIRICPFGGLAAGDDERFTAAGAGLLESLRSYLQACPEQRSKPRWPFPHPLQVYPVLTNRELAAEVTGQGKDLSLGGIGFVVPQIPPGDRIYVRLEAAEFVLLAQVVRVRPLADGGYEVGAAFLRHGLPAES